MTGRKRTWTRSGLSLGPRAQRGGPRRRLTYGPRRGYATVARTRGWAGVKSEMKYFDTFLAETTMPNSADWTGTEIDPATFLNFCNPVKGTGINERIGRHIRIHGIKIRGIIRAAPQANVTATDASTQVRLSLVLDTQTNAAQMQGEQVFEAPGAASSRNCVQTFMSLDNLGRFRVLKDKFISFGNPNISWDGTNMEQNGVLRPFKIFHKFRVPIDVHFNATDGGTIADIVDNSLHLLANESDATLAAGILYEARVSYKDPQ